MKRGEKQEFTDFMIDEAVKYGRSMHPSEIETWFETFPKPSFRDFKAAWIEHKRGDKGAYFPRINDLQRLLRTAGEGATSRDDHQCTWNGDGQRCRYPVGFFSQGAREGYCMFHRAVMAGPGAQAICDESQQHTPEQYLDRAKTHTYRTPPPAVLALRERTERAMAARRRGERMNFEVVIPPRAREPGDEVAEAHIAAADAKSIDEVNAILAMAGVEDAA